MSQDRRLFASLARIGRLLAVTLSLSACATAELPQPAPATDDGLYARLFPYYAEICAVSGMKKRPDFGVPLESGPGGHSVMFLSGVCRDRKAGYPTLVPCDGLPGGTASAGTPDGVGISVNAHFKNAAWVATEGREFFFEGGLGPSERLTSARYARIQTQAERQGILDGVEFHPAVLEDQPAGMAKRDFMYEVSIATDYALSAGRDRICARVPLTRDKTVRIVDYLNALNARYRDGKEDFDWSVLSNNCSHITHNALAAVSLWEPRRTESVLSILDFPVPANEFVNLMQRTNDMPSDSLEHLLSDPTAATALMRWGSLPTEAGAIAEAQPFHAANDLYDRPAPLLFYDEPLLGGYWPGFRTIFAEPRYHDLGANLRYFERLYAGLRGKRPNESAWLAAQSAASADERDRLARLYNRYYEYLERQSAKVDSEISALDSASR